MRVRLTHVALAAPGGGARFADALGIDEDDPGESARRVFVPGWLPCGECGRCRRALVSACAGGRPLFADSARLPRAALTIDVPERFVTAVDVPAEAARLGDELAVCAGLAATLVDATASAGLTPGDLAIWVGDEFIAEAGAALSAARGCQAFWLPAHPSSRPDTPSAAVTVLAPEPGPAAWTAALAAAETGAPPGRRTRRIFVTDGGAVLLGEVCRLLDPGSTIARLGAAGTRIDTAIELPPRSRLLALGGYHPDFVAEGLAVLRRGDLPTAGLARALAVVTLG